jgi:hypothetical protein
MVNLYRYFGIGLCLIFIYLSYRGASFGQLFSTTKWGPKGTTYYHK